MSPNPEGEEEHPATPETRPERHNPTMSPIQKATPGKSEHSLEKMDLDMNTGRRRDRANSIPMAIEEDNI